MVRVSTDEAKTALAALIQQVEDGTTDEVVITRQGRAVARLVPMAPTPAWVPFFGPVPDDLRIDKLPPGEAIAPVYPEGIPWSPSDPV
jgi:prevent-host-death family protein